MAQTLAVGDIVTTDDRPLSLSLCNRKGVIIAQYNVALLPEWLVKWIDGQYPEHPEDIVHEKFLTPLTLDELLKECELNLLIVRNSASPKEALRAGDLALRAAGRFQTLIKEPHVRCECDNLRVPLRCPNKATQILEDNDGPFAACDECTAWWKEYNT